MTRGKVRCGVRGDSLKAYETPSREFIPTPKIRKVAETVDTENELVKILQKIPVVRSLIGALIGQNGNGMH